ncbi:hypothetical protein JOL62DRAFT_264971 [Phyllosticta paracitricarpa]|uniref:Uncharacterized protein n=1 Tax=Phyllosticta paracitricarpa TaxID=2016321 RepID=A0ABR1MXA3_9PEZI
MINGNATGWASAPTRVWVLRDEGPRATGNKPTADCTMVVTLSLTGKLSSPEAGSGRLRTINSILFTPHYHRNHHRHQHGRSQPGTAHSSSSAARDGLMRIFVGQRCSAWPWVANAEKETRIYQIRQGKRAWPRADHIYLQFQMQTLLSLLHTIQQQSDVYTRHVGNHLAARRHRTNQTAAAKCELDVRTENFAQPHGISCLTQRDGRPERATR